MSIIWVTGAGRSGTNLIRQLVDGHPQVNSFPIEFPFVKDWNYLASLASTDGEHLPGTLINEHIISYLSSRPQLKTLMKNIPDNDKNIYSVLSYLEAVHKWTESSKEHFLFNSVGCRLDAFFGSGSNKHSCKVIIMLRHPIQNYLAYLKYQLLSGGGYCLRNDKGKVGAKVIQINPTIGFHSLTQIVFLRVVSAFLVARRFQEDDRVLVSKIEDFSSDPLERQRVWDFLELSADSTLESTTVQGQLQIAGSIAFTGTQIRKVTTDVYDAILSEDEFFCFEQYQQLFLKFYDDSLSSVEIIPNGKINELLYNREKDSLINKQALLLRKKRIKSLLKNRPASLKDVLKWPVRALDTAFMDVFMYPQLRMLRNRQDYKAGSNIKDVLTLLPKM